MTGVLGRVAFGVVILVAMAITAVVAALIGVVGWTAPGRHPDDPLFVTLIIAGTLFVEYWAVLIFTACGWFLVSDLVLGRDSI